MPGIATIFNSPAILLRIFFAAASGAVGVAVVVSTVVIGVVVLKTLSDPSMCSSQTGPFCHTHIVLRSSSSLAFIRIKQAYETDDYYNATETLLDLAQRLNAHLQRKFPNSFVKATASGFSLKPEEISAVKRRRRRSLYDLVHLLQTMPESKAKKKRDLSLNKDCDKKLSACPPQSNNTSITNSTKHPPDFSDNPTKTPPPPTHPGSGTQTTTTTTLSYGPTKDIDSISSPSVPTSNTSTQGSTTTTTMLPMTSVDPYVSNCNISMFNGTSRGSVIYINATLYFNTTNDTKITPQMILDALKSFNPVITLADRCINKSPGKSVFNASLSKVEPPSAFSGDLSFLTKNDTVSLSLLNQTSSVIPPIERVTTTTEPPSTSTTTQTATTSSTLAMTSTSTSTTTAASSAAVG